MRALGQKYMGVRPQKHSEEMFKVSDGEMTMDGGHAIPVNVSISSLGFSLPSFANFISYRTF